MTSDRDLDLMYEKESERLWEEFCENTDPEPEEEDEDHLIDRRNYGE